MTKVEAKVTELLQEGPLHNVNRQGSANPAVLGQGPQIYQQPSGTIDTENWYPQSQPIWQWFQIKLYETTSAEKWKEESNHSSEERVESTCPKVFISGSQKLVPARLHEYTVGQS